MEKVENEAATAEKPQKADKQELLEEIMDKSKDEPVQHSMKPAKPSPPQRPRFDREVTKYTVLQPLRDGKEKYAMGEDFEDPSNHKRVERLLRQNIIGPKGHEWTSSVLAFNRDYYNEDGSIRKDRRNTFTDAPAKGVKRRTERPVVASIPVVEKAKDIAGKVAGKVKDGAKKVYGQDQEKKTSTLPEKNTGE